MDLSILNLFLSYRVPRDEVKMAGQSRAEQSRAEQSREGTYVHTSTCTVQEGGRNDSSSQSSECD